MTMNRKLWYAICRFSSSVPEATICLTLASSWSYTSWTQPLAPPSDQGSWRDIYQEVVGHFGRQPLKFHHAFRLQILNGVVEWSVVSLRRRPRHENVLENFQHKSRVLIECSGGECDEKLQHPLPYDRILCGVSIRSCSPNTSYCDILGSHT